MNKQEIISLINFTIDDEIKNFFHPNPHFIQNRKERLLDFQAKLIDFINKG